MDLKNEINKSLKDIPDNYKVICYVSDNIEFFYTGISIFSDEGYIWLENSIFTPNLKQFQYNMDSQGYGSSICLFHISEDDLKDNSFAYQILDFDKKPVYKELKFLSKKELSGIINELENDIALINYFSELL